MNVYLIKALNKSKPMLLLCSCPAVNRQRGLKAFSSTKILLDTIIIPTYSLTGLYAKDYSTVSIYIGQQDT